MTSLFDELSEKLARDPSLTKRSTPRVDVSLLLFNARDDVRQLWLAAEKGVQAPDARALENLRAAVEKLRPIFGERPPRPGR